MQKVLVTGGAGFIGSNLCDYLLKKDLFVICFDNLITGSKENIKNLLSNPNFEFVEGDIVSAINVEGELDFIYHLACPASPIDYQNYPEETLRTAGVGTLNVLKLAQEKNAKILITSTSEIYGDPLEHPQKETYWGNVNPFGPRACYDEGKRFSEAATYVFLHKYNIDARIIRIFNTYGPNMQRDDGRVVSNFINDALGGVTLKIDGDGSQTRSFCFVSDMVEGIYKTMTVEGTKGEIFNLGNTDEYTIKDFAQKILKLSGSKSTVTYSDNFRENDPMRRKPDISKAKKILDWEPKVGIDEGLQKTIEFYRKNF